MKQLIISLIFSVLVTVSHSQTDITTQQDTIKKATTVDIWPEFPGGKKRMHKIIEDSLQYPETANREGVGGKVVTQFTIDTFGNVIDIKIKEGVREDLDKEAMRLVGLLNGWTPATRDGKKMKIRFSLPITFTPDDNTGKGKKHKRNRQ